MRGSILGAIFSFLVIFAPLSTAGQILKDSPVTCSSEGVQCQFDEDNLIDSVMHVMTLEECRQICLDNEACEFITYFDDSAAPLSHFCQLFKNCNIITNCSNCVSENMDCFQSCSRNVVGDLDENVLEAVPNVDSEMACKQSCLNTTNCSFYTYFFPNSTQYHNYCFLQTEFVAPAQPCNSCVTSPMYCSVECSLTVDGESSKSVMLTSVGQDSEITVSGWLCDLTLLVVGGGGGHGFGSSYGGGGGSGYLQYRSLQVQAGTLLTAKVGDQREASSVTFSTGEDIVTAQPGQDGHGVGTGGDGYSGGGGFGYDYAGAGGTDGGDGERGSYYSGGHGTGEDVSLYSFTTWSLGPGAGGQPNHGNNYYGGGGGGMLVDGSGPQASSYQGAGYGGGGRGYGDGLQGIILMEIK